MENANPITIDQDGNQLTDNARPASVDEQGRFKVANLNGGQARHELSSQWFKRPADERFLDLASLQASVKARAEATTQTITHTKQIEFVAPEPEKIEDTHVLKVATAEGEVEPTHWSFGQLAGLAGAPAAYLRKLPSQIVRDNLNYGMRYLRTNEQVKLYSRFGDDGPLDLRAATGPDYGRIFDHEVVEAVRQVAGNGTGDTRWKIPGVMDWRTMIYDPNVPPSADTTTLYASDRDVFLFLVDDRNPIVVGKARDGQDDIMFRGFYVSNSEVGSGALRLAVFYLRALCCNRIMWGVEGFEEMSMRHSKNAPARFIAEARPALAALTERSEIKLRDAVERAKAAKLVEDDDDAVAWLRKRANMNEGQAKKVLDIFEKEEGGKARTAWDFAQGITALARSNEHQDNRVALERVAGRILDKVA